MFILSQAQNQFQNMQNNPQTGPATASGQPDELKGMMQQILQGQQIQGKALNQRQHGTLPGKTDKNPKDCNAVELRSGMHLPDPISKKLTAEEKGKQKKGKQPPLEDVLDDEQDAEQPTVVEPVAPTTEVQPVPTLDKDPILVYQPPETPDDLYDEKYRKKGILVHKFRPLRPEIQAQEETDSLLTETYGKGTSSSRISEADRRAAIDREIQ
ncbi:hypothetical protein F2Q70_00030965 [Brassica cretica]|uniref:Uncharacterized protein n=1 Tax=Brassica cretica TaxID=69181 RepID=A0A8S9FLX2_BRACR|nr:hypothetical protein F2Q70_00030965 [Brassica cretica]